MFSIIEKLLTIFLLIIYFGGINASLIAYFEYKVNYDLIVKNLCVQKDNPDNQCQGSCNLKKISIKATMKTKKARNKILNSIFSLSLIILEKVNLLMIFSSILVQNTLL